MNATGESIGTIWIAWHREDRRFDAEDVRIMTSLGRFAVEVRSRPSLDALRTTASGRALGGVRGRRGYRGLANRRAR